MKFQIKNIGAIEQANIEIEGITIIAGENNVGKSTVGKALFAFLNRMSSWQKLYANTCSDKIEKFLYQKSTLLEDWCMSISGAKRRRTSKASQLINKYSEDEDFRVFLEDYQVAEDQDSKEETRANLRKYFEEYCHEYLNLYVKDNANKLWDENINFITEWIEKAIEDVCLLELDEVKLQKGKIVASFQETFQTQYRKIGTIESEIVFKDDDDREVKFVINDEREVLNVPIRLLNNIYFVESPKIYDILSDTTYGHVQKEYLRYLMSPNIFKKVNRYWRINFRNNSMETGGNREALQDITERLVDVMGGKAEFLQKVGLEFKDEKLDETIHAVNVSTGLKSLALLEYALRIGAIEDGDILILDEPEINLHPEWQVEYAKALVMLQKKYHLKIVITTHSPYFMRAIECFMDVYDTMDKLNVYRISKERQGGGTKVVNVSYSEYGITDLYDELSAPLENLEALLDEKYGDGNTEEDD